MARREVNENEKGEPSAHGVVKINPTEMDIQIDTLKHKVICIQFGGPKTLNLGNYKSLSALSSEPQIFPLIL